MITDEEKFLRILSGEIYRVVVKVAIGERYDWNTSEIIKEWLTPHEAFNLRNNRDRGFEEVERVVIEKYENGKWK